VDISYQRFINLIQGKDRMANLLMLQDKLGEDFKGKRNRRQSKFGPKGGLVPGQNDSPGKELVQLPAKYQIKSDDDDKQVSFIFRSTRGLINEKRFNL
jgi:hypothetical protein